MLENDIAPTEPKTLSPSEAHEAKQVTSFFDNEPEVANSPPQENGAEILQSQPISDWSYTDGVAGEGPRPAWLKDKYKTVADQASAYSELEKKLGEFKGAPKEGYKFEDVEGLDVNDPLLQRFLPKFKEMNMSQDAVKALITEFSGYQASVAKVDVQAEIKKLGLEGQDMITKTNQWMENNLDPSVAETVKSWIQTAEDMKALNALRAFQPLSRSPTISDMQAAVSYETLKEVKNEKINNWQKYQDDPNYRKALNDRMARAIHRQDAQKKR